MSRRRRSEYKSSYRRSRRRAKRRKRQILISVSIITLVIITLGTSLALGFNPFLERQLRLQFGDAFFSDFSDLPEVGEGDDLESIIENYEPTFEALEQKAMERLDNLLTTALDEYYQKEREGTLDRFVLTNKYIQAGRILEKNVDQTFYELLDKMEDELSRKGLPTEITDKIEKEYQDAKDDKKRELLNKLRSKVGS